MPVNEAGIGCAYRGGDYWEPFDDADPSFFSQDQEPVKAVPRSVSRQEELGDGVAAAGAAGERRQETAISASKATGALYNERGRGTDNGQRVRGRPDSEQFGGALRRPNRSGMLGQEQSVSYQAEERYWTDYLRIALPIAGLLLLLGVFWYWASSYIGDDNDNDPQTPVAQVVNTPITANTPTPTAGSAVELNPVTAAPTQETQAAEPTDEPDTQPTPTTEEATDPGEEPSGDGTFAEGDLVTVNDNDVNLRAEASTDAEIVATLINGEELTVLSGEPIDDGTYVWWNVENLDGLQGWVAGDFIEASS